MENNLTKYKDDLKQLLVLGAELHMDLLKSAKSEPPKDAGKKFNSKYQNWYSEAHQVVSQILPNRLAEFERLYHDPKRKKITETDFSIHDWLLGIRSGVDAYSRQKSFNDLGVVLGKFNVQYDILQSAERRFESSLFEIKQLVQADLFDSEIDSSRELLKRGFLRAAGAVAGVILEKHLKQVCENHKTPISKKNPTISDLNDLVKKVEAIDVPTWRFIQRLGDLRNHCDHDKDTEPTKDQVNDLIEGTAKILKTVF